MEKTTKTARRILSGGAALAAALASSFGTWAPPHVQALTGRRSRKSARTRGVAGVNPAPKNRTVTLKAKSRKAKVRANSRRRA